MPPTPLRSFSVEGKTVKLGRVRPPTPRLTLKLSRYTGVGLPPPPASLDYYSKVKVWPMYANQRLGCCVASTVGHMLGCWSALGIGSEVLFTDEQIVAFYSAVGGYDPRYPWTDQGLVIADALTYACRPDSLLDAGSTRAFVEVDVGESLMRLLSACDIFGGLHVGINLPLSAQRQTGPGKVWDVGTGRDYQPGSWGGHSVPIVGFDQATKRVKMVTWGDLQDASFAFVQRYVDEAFALVDTNWIAADRPTPHGVDLAGILANFAELGGGIVPIPVPPPPPPPPVPPAGSIIAIDLGAKQIVAPPGWRLL